jgi:hypothetical protein
MAAVATAVPQLAQALLALQTVVAVVAVVGSRGVLRLLLAAMVVLAWSSFLHQLRRLPQQAHRPLQHLAAIPFTNSILLAPSLFKAQK